MERQKNTETLFISPKNISQVFPEDTQNTDERDTLKPKSNKNFLQLPTSKKNFFFQSMKNLSTSKDQANQNSKDAQGQSSKQGKLLKQNTAIIKTQTKNESGVKDQAAPIILQESQKNPTIVNIKSKQQEKRDSPMHLDPLMIYSPSINNIRRNSLINASILSGEKSKRRISNFQKSLFQKKMKNDDEFGGGPNGLNDKDFEQNAIIRKSFPSAMVSDVNLKHISNIPPQVSGESEISHISSIMHKGRIFSNQRRATELTSSNNNNQQSRKSSSSTKRKWNFVKKLGLVRKFIDKLQAQSSVYLFSRLTKQHVATINDKSYVFGDERKISLFTLALKMIAQYFKQKSWLKPISPESEVIVYMSLFFLCAYTFLLYWIPLYVVFSINGNIQEQLLGRIIPLTILFFDILVKCNTQYYKQGNIVLDRKKILKNYLKKYFFYDMLILIGFAYTQSSTIFHLVILFKLRDLVLIEDIIHQKFFISQNIQPSYTLIKLIYVDLFLAHMFSCGFIFVAKIGAGYQNWITENDLDHSLWIEQYVTSLYFSIITMTTVGFGDIHPYNSLEKIYVSVVTMISSGIFGYTLSVIGGIMHEKFQKEADYKRKKYDLNHYMSMRSIAKSIQLKALKYLDYIKHKDDQQPLRGQDIVYHLSDDLQKLIKRDFYGSILNQYKILNFNFSPQCLADLALRMQESYYGPGEIIYTQNNLDDRIFFVAKGRVELFTETNIQQYPFEVIQKGQAFGKDSFFGQPLLQTSAKSVSFSLIVFCSSLEFKDVLMNYPEDYEKYCMMRDNLIVNSKPFQNSCLICKKLYHTVTSCPLMHHVRKKEFIVHKYIHSEPMERQQKERRKYDKFNALKQVSIIKRDLKKIRQNMVKTVKEKKLNHKINKFSSTSSSSISSSSSEGNKKEGGRRLGISIEKDDRQFYMRNPKIECVDGSIQIDSAYSDILSDSMSLSEYNNYFFNLEQAAGQIIRVNSVETIQEEKSANNIDDEQSQSYAYQRYRRRSVVPQLQSQQYNLFNNDFQLKEITENGKEKIKANSDNMSGENNGIVQSLKYINDNTISSNKPVFGSNTQLETPVNGNRNQQRFDQSPSEILKEFQKKDSLAYLQQLEGIQDEDQLYTRQASHKEPLLNRTTTPVQINKIFNKQLSVKNVSNPSKFYQKERSLRQVNGQQVPLSPYPPQCSMQQSSQFSLSSINDLNQSPQHNKIDSSQLFSPGSKLNNTKVFFSNRPVSSIQRSQNVSTISGIQSSGSAEKFAQLITNKNLNSLSNQPTPQLQQQKQLQTQFQPNQQSSNQFQANNLFGVSNFRKPFLEKPAHVSLKKLSIMSDFNQEPEQSLGARNPIINPQIAQIQANAQQQQARRESHLSVNFNNTTLLNNSRRATLINFPLNLNQILPNKVSTINNNDETPKNGLLIKNIQIYSPKNSGSGHLGGGNSLTIPGTPISGFGLHPHLSMNKDISLLMKNVSVINTLSSPMQSNIPLYYRSQSDDNNVQVYDQFFIPLDLDTIKEYKKYFPEGNFSSQFKEKIKIMKLLSRKFSNNAKDNPNLKKIIQKKLSKLNSISQKRSFLKQNSKFSAQSFQNNLNIQEFAHIKSANITPNVSINGIK